MGYVKSKDGIKKPGKLSHISDAEFMQAVQEFSPAGLARKLGVRDSTIRKKVERIKAGRPQGPAMAAGLFPEKEFIEQFEVLGASKMARRVGVTKNSISNRAFSLGLKDPFAAGGNHTSLNDNIVPATGVKTHAMTVKDGVVVVGGDCHFWPGQAPATAWRGFLRMIETLKPKAVVLNGDVLDAPSASRFPPIGWEEQPELWAELEECKLRLSQAQEAANGARLIWPLGNHDARFNTRLATNAPEFKNVPGTKLVHHFPAWEACWALFINDDVVVKHRFKSGTHAPFNNTMWGGRTMLTGHLHSAKVQPFTDYNGTRFGVDCGTLSNPNGPQYLYNEQNPQNHVSAFCVLTFKDGRLLWPELATTHSEQQGLLNWRGTLIKV